MQFSPPYGGKWWVLVSAMCNQQWHPPGPGGGSESPSSSCSMAFLAIIDNPLNLSQGKGDGKEWEEQQHSAKAYAYLNSSLGLNGFQHNAAGRASRLSSRTFLVGGYSKFSQKGIHFLSSSAREVTGPVVLPLVSSSVFTLNWSSSKQSFMLWPTHSFSLHWLAKHFCTFPLADWCSRSFCCYWWMPPRCLASFCLGYWYYLHVTLTSHLTALMLGSCMLETLLPSLLWEGNGNLWGEHTHCSHSIIDQNTPAHLQRNLENVVFLSPPPTPRKWK